MTGINVMRNRALARDQADTERTQLIARRARITETRDALNNQLAHTPTGINAHDRLQANVNQFWDTHTHHTIQAAYNALTLESDRITDARRHQLETN